MKLTMEEVLAALLRPPSADMTKEASEAHRGRAFYARVLFACKRTPSDEVDSIDFTVVDGRPFLLYNEQFLRDAGLHEAVLHLERAAIGLVLDHVPRALEMAAAYPEEQQAQARRMVDVATYVTANEHIRADAYYVDAKYGVVPLLDASDLRGLLEQAGYKLDIKDGESVEYYVNRTLPASEGAGSGGELPAAGGQQGAQAAGGGGQQPGAAPGSGDGEDEDDGRKPHWSDAFPRRPDWSKGATGTFSPESAAHSFRAHAKAILARAREDTLKSRGTIPADIQEWLDKYLRDSQVPWWKVLAERIVAHMTVKGERSPAVYNRRRASLGPRVLPVFGRDVDPTFRIFLLLDTSGSMSAADMAVVFREVEAILALNDAMTVRFMQGDATVHVDVVYKAGDRIEYKVVGRGGTDFDAYFKYMNQYCTDPETRPDLAIVGTDGCCPPVRASNRLPEDVPVIFLLTSPPSSPWWQAIQRDGYGDLIHVDPQHRATTV